MPSTIHQALLALLESYPRLAFELAAACGAHVLGTYVDFDAAPAEFEDPGRRGVMRYADAVVLGLSEVDGERVVADALVIEIQLNKDPSKFLTWSIYRAGVRSRHKCCGWTLVLSLDPQVRMWARSLFEREPELTPPIVEAHMIPVVDTLDFARTRLDLAILSAAFHGPGPNALTRANVTLRALNELAPESHERYAPLVTHHLNEDQMPQTLKFPPSKKVVPISDMERRHWAFKKGHRAGVAEGKAEGKTEGKASERTETLQTLRASLIEILDRRGLALDDEHHARIEACTDVDVLSHWIVRAATVDAIADVWV